MRIPIVPSLMILLLLTPTYVHAKSDEPAEDIPLSDFVHLLKLGRVQYVEIGHDRLTGEFEGPQQIRQQIVNRFRIALPEG